MTLLRFISLRILFTIPTLFGLVTLVFFLTRLLPGDAASVFIGPGVPPALADDLRRQFGLDQPLFEQYVSYIGSVFTGNLGHSFTHHAPVTTVLAEVLPNTALLGIAALILEILLAVSLAFFAARNTGSLSDRIISQGSLIAYALPSFWVGILLLTFFSYGLDIFPSSQMRSSSVSGESSLGGIALHLVLPAFTVAIPGAALLTRFLRSSLGRIENQEYVMVAKSMGVSESRIFRSYVLPNAIGPVISLIGVECGILLTGVVVTETLFAWPGMGRLVVVSIFARDYPLLLGCTLVAGFIVIAANTLADLLQKMIDPRLRLDA
ncbi:MAG: ABC transporter permease [Bacteroidota bacterium]